VGFTRDPATGENQFYGEFLTNAQGEDVVAGVRTPEPIAKLAEVMPDSYRQLNEITKKLEHHYRDVQDFEFTIQESRLYLLQTRTGQRTGTAAVRIAVEMVAEGLITREEALLRVTPAHIDQCLHPRLDPKAKLVVIARGLAASPGAAVGRAVFDADLAMELAKKKGERVILVRKETTPDDIHGIDAAQGILTATGGMTSHAAVVTRGMGKPCVAGAGSIRVDEKARCLRVDGVTVKEGEWLTLDGGTGRVILGQVPTLDPDLGGEFGTLMSWTDEHRRLKVRSNADIPRDAKKAREFGAEGIGLCRTEHMFFAEDRLPWVVQMIMNAPRAKALREQLAAKQAQLEGADPGSAVALRREIANLKAKLAEPEKAYRQALAKLLPLQRSDFRGLFEAMDGYPVTIRTLDPPLHEFLPKREELMVDIVRLPRATAAQKKEMAKRYRLTVARLRKMLPELLERVEELHEFNPMLGHRGCRLGITYPEVTEMQARAIFEAACDAAKKGARVVPEIMIPLVGAVAELRHQAAVVRRVAEEVMTRKGVRVEYLVGTMIEVPRAAVTAAQIAEEAEFFSFGTNDLTQLTFGFSRDDAGKFLPEYVSRKILPVDPFVSIDTEGVGALVKWAVEKGRSSRAKLKVGICGEHGGDPASVEFCHGAGLDYVSCSPFRVPVARLAAAQAVLRGRAASSDQR
jgi:pyruvate,orthophosphate dikinase